MAEYLKRKLFIVSRSVHPSSLVASDFKQVGEYIHRVVEKPSNAPEILYVLREPVTVSAPIADVPFIAATIPFLAGTLNTSPTIDIRIEGALRKTGAGGAGYDLYISDSPTSLVGGLKIATLSAASTGSGAGFKRTFTLRPSNIIEGYSFTAANLIDTVTYGSNASSSGTMPNRSENVYIHLVATASATPVYIRAIQLNAIKL